MHADKQDILKRFHNIEGHLGGIGKMIEEDSSCIDVLRQSYAVRKAIEKLEALLLVKMPCSLRASEYRERGRRSSLRRISAVLPVDSDPASSWQFSTKLRGDP